MKILQFLSARVTLLVLTTILNCSRQIRCNQNFQKLLDISHLNNDFINISNYRGLFTVTPITVTKHSLVFYTDLEHIYVFDLLNSWLKKYPLAQLSDGFKVTSYHCSSVTSKLNVMQTAKKGDGLTSNLILSICFEKCQTAVINSFCFLVPISVQNSEVKYDPEKIIKLENFAQIYLFDETSENEDRILTAHGLNTGTLKPSEVMFGYNLETNVLNIRWRNDLEFDFGSKIIENNQQKILLSNSQKIFKNENAIGISIYTQDNWIQSDNEEIFTIIVSNFSNPDETKSVSLSAKCQLLKATPEKCKNKDLIQSKLALADISESRITVTRSLIHDLSSTEFCSIDIDDLIYQYEQCFNSAQCSINGKEIQTTPDISAKIFLDIKSFSVIDVTEKDFMLAITKNPINDKILLERFVFKKFRNEDQNTTSLFQLDTILILENNSELELKLAQSQLVLKQTSSAKQKTEFLKLSQFFPQCDSASNCFQCQSNVFGLRSKCKWQNNRCEETSDPNTHPICSPVIESVSPTIVHLTESYDITIYGSSLSHEFKVSCKVFTENNPKSGSPHDDVIIAANQELNSFNFAKEVQFNIGGNLVHSLKSLKCQANFEKVYRGDLEMTLDSGSVEFPSLIKITDPKITNVYPKIIPFTTGTLLTVEGENLWNGDVTERDPELEITQVHDDNRFLIACAHTNRTANSITFLVKKPKESRSQPSQTLQPGEAFVSLQYGSLFRRWQRDTLTIQDPSNIQMIQDKIIKSGGMDVVFIGNAIEAIPKPVLITTVLNQSSAAAEIIFESGEKNCKFQPSQSEIPFAFLKCRVTPIPRYLTSDNLDYDISTVVSLKSSKSLKDLHCVTQQETCGFFDDLLSGEENEVTFVDNPTIYKIDGPNSLKLNSAQDRLLNISYSDMDLDWLKYRVVSVLIGDSGECVIKNYTNTTLTCEAPSNIPRQSPIMVYLGTEYSVNVGMFYYEKETSMFLLYLTIGCSIAFLFIFLFISFIVCLQRKSKSQDQKDGYNGPTLSTANNISMHSLDLANEDPVSIIPEEELEQLNEFTDSKGIQIYASQRVSPVLILGISEKPIGHGQFGEVYRAVLKYPQELNRNRNTDLINIALKCVRKRPNSHQNKQIWSQLIQEGDSMTDFSHKNVLGMLGFSYIFPPNKSDAEFCIVLPFMNAGNLHSYLRQNGSQLHNDLLADFAFQAACGMEYLHDNGILHQDLAARNCMLDIAETTSEVTLKVSDFGLSTEATSQQKASVLPIMWCAPELLKSQNSERVYYQNGTEPSYRDFCSLPVWSKEADVWAYGVLVWEIFHEGRNPYQHLGKVSTDNMKYQIAYNQERPRIESHVEMDTMIEIMNLCWKQDPKDRPTFREIRTQLEHLFDLADEQEDAEEADSNTFAALPTERDASAINYSHNDAYQDDDNPRVTSEV